MALTYHGRDDQKRDRHGYNQHRTIAMLIATAYGGNWQHMTILDGGEEVAWYRRKRDGRKEWWIRDDLDPTRSAAAGTDGAQLPATQRRRTRSKARRVPSQ